MPPNILISLTCKLVKYHAHIHTENNNTDRIMRGSLFILSDLVVGRLSADTTNFHPLHIILTWASSPSVYCEALYYEVAYSLLQQDGCRTIPPREQEITVAGNSTGTQFKIKHLHLFSTYKFFVRAFTETGEGNYSEMRYETPEGGRSMQVIFVFIKYYIHISLDNGYDL